MESNQRNKIPRRRSRSDTVNCISGKALWKWRRMVRFSRHHRRRQRHPVPVIRGSYFAEDEYRALASRAGERLLELGVPRAEGGLSWKGAPATSLGLLEDAYFPNFELGTAGVAYVLARLYEETGNSNFLDAARQGALHLQQIATVRGRGALIPYRYPDLTDIYYLGFCHGPAGSARLFYQLYKVTKESSYLDWTESLARGVIDSGIPTNQTPGFYK